MHRKLLLLLITLLLTIHFGALYAQDATPPNTSILQLIDSEPLSGEELSGRQPLTFYFDRELDCNFQQDPLIIEPNIAGDVVCEGATLTFTPAVPYTPATLYSVTISADVVRAGTAQLLESPTLSFPSQGNLAVSEVFPVPGSNVPADTVITVIFNRPVVPLSVGEPLTTAPMPIRILPDVAGRGEWVNTSIYVFTPSRALDGATSYTVTVESGLTTADGATLLTPYTWTFTTTLPEVIEIFPLADSTKVKLDTPIQVRFNQPMDRPTVEEAFYLRLDVDADVPRTLGTFQWTADSTGFSFKPAENLRINSAYRVGFDSDLLPLQGTTEWSFFTVPLPSIIATSPFDGEVDVSPYSSINLYFASPMNIDTLPDKIRIEPPPRDEPEFFYRDWEDGYGISFTIEPSTTYTVRIAPGMADIYGNTINSELTFSFTTSAYEPDVVLQVPGGVGFYSAYREQTQLFLTHRNVSYIDLSLYNVGLNEFIALLAGDTYYDPTQNYAPLPNQLIRNWRIQRDVPENIFRYELLTLGTEGNQTQISCVGSPPSRLKVGDRAIVITEPDPVRARTTPPDGEIVDLLYRGYSVVILEGPICANDILWWRVQLREERQAWIAEGVGDEYFIEPTANAQITPVTVPPTGEGGKLTAGIYLLQATAPELSETFQPERKHFLMVMTANLTVKAGLEKITVWATDVQSGRPIANAPITIYDANLQILGQGTTDDQGLVTIDTPAVTDLYARRVAVLDDGTNFGIGLTEWTNGIEPWNYNLNYDYFPRQYHVYIYTDRSVYRPGQPVYYRGVVRNKNDVRYTPPDLESVPLRITNDRGDIIYEANLPLSPFGTFSGELLLADDASLGYYNISVELPSDQQYSYEGGGVGFSVAEYRLPEFFVNLSPQAEEVVQGDTITLTLDSRFFFGGAVSNANVTYNVIAEPFYFDYDSDRPYEFVDLNLDEGASFYYGPNGGVIASGEGVTDDRGMLTFEIASQLGEEEKQSQIYTIEALVTDESQQTVAGRTQVVVHQGLFYLGIAPDSYVSREGDETFMHIIAVDWAGKALADQPIQVEVIERIWSSVQEQDASGRTTWTYEVEEVPLTSAEVRTDAEGKAQFSFIPPNGGIFKIRVSAQDTVGNTIRASNLIWVSGREYVAWRQQNSKRIDLVADKQSYEIGDVAKILIASPFQGSAEALISVERGDVLKIEHITLDSNSYVYELPITEEYSPNIFVSALIVKGVDDFNPVADFRMGAIQLGVSIERKAIAIDITPDRERAQPRETVTYTVKTTDYKGDPISAEVGVSLTDLASLSIAPPNTIDILRYFYGQQGLSIRTAIALTLNTDLLTQITLDTVKGGGGGGGDGGIIEVRGEFIDTAYWNGALITDEDGLASFSVRLPDNLTTWRLDARAITRGDDGLTLVGQETFDLISAKPLIVRPQTPRFFVVGDNVVLAMVINNNTNQNLEVRAQLLAEGLTVADDTTQMVSVPADGRIRVAWAAKVNDVPAVRVAFTAESDEFSDGAVSSFSLDDEGSLPVYRYEAPEVVGTAGVLRSADTRVETIVLPQRFADASGELSIQLDQSLAAATLDGLDYLKNYPYQSTEATISRLLPNIITLRALKQLGQSNPTLEANLDSEINFALQTLYADQQPDGGWGWYERDTSDPVTTAYGLIALSEALKEGYPVSEAVIRNAQAYLQTQFIVPDLSQPTWRLNRQSFVLYALARSGQPDVARTTTLYENRDRLSIYSKAWLAQTLYFIDATDSPRLDALIKELVDSAIVSASGIHWQEASRDFFNWNTDTRTTAIALQTFVLLRPQSDLLPNVVRYLMAQRRADAWETTQETAWAVMALTDWMLASGELNADYRYSVALNDTEQYAGVATPQTIRDSQRLSIPLDNLQKTGVNALVFNRDAGDGALYYTAHLRAFLPVTALEPLNRGIILQRQYSLQGDANNQPITSGRVGDIVRVRLTIILPNDLHYVVIEDPLPAGAEAINPDLETSQQIGTRPGLVTRDPLAKDWGWWWFSSVQFRDEKVVLSSAYLPAGTYEFVYSIRLGFEGTYNVIPATGQEFYFPEVYGRSAGAIFTILPADE